MYLQIGSRGLRLYPDYFDREAQLLVLAAIRGVLTTAPLFTARMPKSGRPMSVGMSNCGPLGWFSDERGYRYRPEHPRPISLGPRSPSRCWNYGARSRFIRTRRKLA